MIILFWVPLDIVILDRNMVISLLVLELEWKLIVSSLQPPTTREIVHELFLFRMTSVLPVLDNTV
jgi:hypothetical protein